jgi:hypothetical protein
MRQTTAKTPQALRQFNKWSDRAIARTIRAGLNAIAAPIASRAERLATVKAGSQRTQSFEELKERGERARSHAVELRRQALVNGRASQDLCAWLYATHLYRPRVG